MNFYMIYLVLVILVLFNILNAAIIVQAPKYVSKRALQNLVRKYYLQLMNRRRFDTNKGKEIEIPISPSISQQYRYSRRSRRPVEKHPWISRRERQKYTEPPPPTTILTQPPIQVIQPQVVAAPVLPISAQLLMPSVSLYHPPDLQYALASADLRRAEEAVEKHLKASPIKPRRRSGSLSREIHQEDVQKALDRLEARLKAGGNRPATLDDLMKMIDEVEKKILGKQEVLATSTPDPCGEEAFLEEALQPALKKDLWEVMSLAQKCGGDTKFGQAVGEIAQADENTRRAIQLTIRNPEEKETEKLNSHEEIWSQTRRNIGHEILDLLEGDFDTSIAPDVKSLRRSVLGEHLLDLLKHGVAVEENPRVLEDKGLIPIKIEVPKSFKDIIIKA